MKRIDDSTIMKKLLTPLCLTFLLAFSASFSAEKSAPKKTSSGSANDVILTVGGNSIKRKQMDTLANMMLKQRAASNSQAPLDIENLHILIANNLIGQELLDIEGKKIGLKAEPKEVDSLLNLFKKNFGGDQQFKAALAEAGDSEKSLREKIIRQIKADKLLNKQLKEISKPSEKEMQDFFIANKSKFPIDDSLRASQIVLLQTKESNGLEKKNQLEKIRKELIQDSGDIFLLLRKFTQYAMQFSETPEKAAGGDLHLFAPKDFSADFSKNVSLIKAGQISPVFKTSLGYHLVMGTERHDGQYQSYRYAIAQAIAGQQTQKNSVALRTYLQSLATKYPVVYVDKSLKDKSAMAIYSTK